jgi:hypothetical protein
MTGMKQPAAQLSVGDVHYADNGRPRTVAAVDTDQRGVVVTFDDGTSETFTPDLPVRIRRPRKPDHGDD